MRRVFGRKIIPLFLSVLFILAVVPMTSLAAPSGTATQNCWGSGGQLEIQLSGCSGYKTITVVAEFSGTIDSASGWGFDSYVIDGNRVTATCSSDGPNSWGFDNKVGIQVSGSDVNSAELISVTGDGTSGSVGTETSATTAATSGGSSDPSATAAPARNVEGVEGDDWLTTIDSHIVDMNGTEVWLTGCNWFGYNTGTNIFDGVWNCNLENSIASIADHGFNVLRVPMSAELLLQWKNGEYPAANYNQAYNEKLNSMNSLEIFDYVLTLCEQNGIKVIIDIHTVKTDASGHNYAVWYRDDISVDDFVESLSWIADRYKDNDTIIGYDLKNEPHGKASETPHAIWNDSDDPDNWKAVAERAGNAVLDANPHALIIIEGIQIYPTDISTNNFTSTNDDDYYNTWWGANLMAVRDYPIDFGSPERNAQIVYSPHDYGPRVYEQPWFEGGDFTYDSLMDDAWYDYWLYIQDENIAPIFVGEWGGFMEGDNLKWMEYFRQLIAEKHLHHTFWCYNANSGDTGGLVKDDFQTWDEEKYDFVKEVLWQTEDGEFIGLDHAVPLGSNGIALSDYTGVTVTPAPVTPAASSETATEETTIGMTDAAVIQATEGVLEEAVNSNPVFDTLQKATKELLVVAIVIVLLIILIAAVRIAVYRWSEKRKQEEEIILHEPRDPKVDENNTNEINSVGDSDSDIAGYLPDDTREDE